MRITDDASEDLITSNCLYLPLFASTQVRITRRFPKLAPVLASFSITRVGVGFICLYYINEALTVLQASAAACR